MPNPDSLKSKLKSLCCRTDDLVVIPLVSIGPSGIGGDYQREKVE